VGFEIRLSFFKGAIDWTESKSVIVFPMAYIADLVSSGFGNRRQPATRALEHGVRFTLYVGEVEGQSRWSFGLHFFAER
jgi:hypothetical protein